MGIVLWSVEGEPYGSDLNEPYEKVTIKMIRIEVYRVNIGKMSDLKELTL